MTHSKKLGICIDDLTVLIKHILTDWDAYRDNKYLAASVPYALHFIVGEFILPIFISLKVGIFNDRSLSPLYSFRHNKLRLNGWQVHFMLISVHSALPSAEKSKIFSLETFDGESMPPFPYHPILRPVVEMEIDRNEMKCVALHRIIRSASSKRWNSLFLDELSEDLSSLPDYTDS